MMNQSLATRFRPNSLKEVVGQSHLVGENGILTKIVEKKILSSMIFYGPPGTGKTTIASAISKDLGLKFEYFNASTHSKDDLKKIVERATPMFPAVIFIDEIHRLTKQNQDYLLMKLEDGFITIIGATTENPYLSVNPALRSRSRVFELKKVPVVEIVEHLKDALQDKKKGLGNHNARIEDESLEFIASYSNGDLRLALNTLELAVEVTDQDENEVKWVTQETLEGCLQRRQIEGDKDGDGHYNLLSAFQKSIRGSDVDASLHYLARLIEIGDLVSINRRLLVIAYEDIGLANPDAVNETLNAVVSSERVGFPEARIILGYIVVRLALSEKSNVAYKGINAALNALASGRETTIPNSLHDTHYKGASALNKGEGYKYAHDYKNSVVPQQYLPDEFKDDRYLNFRGEDDTPKYNSVYNNLNSFLKGK